MNNFQSADSQNRAEQILRIGRIAEIDNPNRLVRIQSAELLSDWIPWKGRIGNNYIAWTPPRKGTQVLTASPSGDYSQAIIVMVLYTDDLNSPSTDADVDMIKFNDGTIIKKDSKIILIDTPCAVQINSPSLTHNGVNIGSTHKHVSPESKNDTSTPH